MAVYSNVRLPHLYRAGREKISVIKTPALPVFRGFFLFSATWAMPSGVQDVPTKVSSLTRVRLSLSSSSSSLFQLSKEG